MIKIVVAQVVPLLPSAHPGEIERRISRLKPVDFQYLTQALEEWLTTTRRGSIAEAKEIRRKIAEHLLLPWSATIPPHAQDAIAAAVQRQMLDLPANLLTEWHEPRYLERRWLRDAARHIEIPYPEWWE